MSDTPSGARVPAPPSQSPRLDLAAMARKAGLTRMPQPAQNRASGGLSCPHPGHFMCVSS